MADTILTRSSSMTTWKDASPATDNFFTGSLQTGTNSYDPYVSGYAFIMWLKVPTWVPNGDSFKQFSQKNFKSFQGLSNQDLETEGAKMGFSVNETHYTKSLAAKSSEFTLKYQEHSGSPMTTTYDAWVSGIRDPKTNIATYPALSGLPYHSSNHTGTLLYIVTRPDANNFAGNNIEKAFLWTHVQPKRINLEHYNFEQGSHDMFDLDQPFSGYLSYGEEVDSFAASYAATRIYNFYSENSFDNINQYTGG